MVDGCRRCLGWGTVWVGRDMPTARRVKCDRCRGSGNEPSDCPACEGTGRRRIEHQGQAIDSYQCRTCGGTGLVKNSRNEPTATNSAADA